MRAQVEGSMVWLELLDDVGRDVHAQDRPDVEAALRSRYPAGPGADRIEVSLSRHGADPWRIADARRLRPASEEPPPRARDARGEVRHALLAAGIEVAEG